MKYQIDGMENGHGVFCVRATSYNDAARIAARRMFGRRGNMTGVRVTGNDGNSGMFNAYYRLGNALTSRGHNFHVREV